MLFLLGPTVGAVLMILAQRRAKAIRHRVESRWGLRRPASWEGWRQAMHPAHFRPQAWGGEPS